MKTAETKLRLRTKFAFAVLTALGGMLVGTGDQTGSYAIIVVFFAVVGFVFVDWQRLFALPSMVAYAAMAVTAVVCVAEFIEQTGMISQKMVAVAQLLAAAQAILMLQEKSERLFEQLLVFALLNCVVAAVFNDAFSYAIWFIPLTVTTGIALALLSADQTLQYVKPESLDDPSWQPNFPTWTNQACIASFSRIGTRLPLVTAGVFFPAIVALAAAFFFALPRRIEAQRGHSSQAMVGYRDSVELKQIGKMQRSGAQALRVTLTDAETKAPYPVASSVYLRGRVLETYRTRGELREADGTWSSAPAIHAAAARALPAQYIDDRASTRNLYDRVNIDVSCEAMQTSSLFAISPYHRLMGSQEVLHRPAQWTLTRRDSGGSSSNWFPRIQYRFGTHAFQNGIQNRWTAYIPLVSKNDLLASNSRSRFAEETGDANIENTSAVSNENTGSSPAVSLSAADLDYMDLLLDYPDQWVPTAAKIADDLVDELPASKQNPAAIAEYFSNHLASGQVYAYTLDLTATPIIGMDPLEQFLSIDRRGHCQYFAAALVMMLRSQGIPARLVVGYHCDEFNELGQRFVVRQSHAHAWAEALIDREDIPLGNNLAGQPRCTHYWMRLDPTPGGGGVDDTADTAGTQVFEMARSLWTDYVVEMNPQRQRTTLLSTPGMAPMTASYRSWIERVKDFAMRVNAGEVRGLGGGKLFSTTAALLAIGLSVFSILAVKMRLPGWLLRKWKSSTATQAAKPSIPFYAETLDLLQKIGIVRQSGQTPVELVGELNNKRPDDQNLAVPVRALTDVFYEMRYGGSSTTQESQIKQWLDTVRGGVERKS